MANTLTQDGYALSTSMLLLERNVKALKEQSWKHLPCARLQ